MCFLSKRSGGIYRFFKVGGTFHSSAVHGWNVNGSRVLCRDVHVVLESWETHRPVKASSSPSSCCSGISSSLARPPPPPPPAVPFTCPSSFKENTDFLGERSTVPLRILLRLPSTHWWLNSYLLSADRTFFGGSMRILGSHSPGGRTITSSKNSSMPAIRSSRSLAL